jgi:hypothetical protein
MARDEGQPSAKYIVAIAGCWLIEDEALYGGLAPMVRHRRLVA